MFFAPDINTDSIVKLSDPLSVTDKEQTVCDMIRYNRHEFHLFETVLNAYEGDVDIARLEILAKNYNILDKLKWMDNNMNYQVGQILNIGYWGGFLNKTLIKAQAEVVGVSGNFIRIKVHLKNGGCRKMFGYDFQLKEMENNYFL